MLGRRENMIKIYIMKKNYFNEINLKIILMYERHAVPPQATHMQSLAPAPIILQHEKLKNNAIQSMIPGSSLMSLNLTSQGYCKVT